MSKARELAELGAVYDSGALSNRNMLYNGKYAVAQRGTSYQFSNTNASVYGTADRWIGRSSQGTTLTQSIQTDAPDGFTKSLRYYCDSGGTITQMIRHQQVLEGRDWQHLAYGTADAKTVTLSFWVKSNVTATYTVSLYVYDANDIYTVTYTIDSADTWEYKTLTFTGNTSGNCNDDGSTGIELAWALGAASGYKGAGVNDAWQSYGSTKYATNITADIGATTGNYWQITGAQLEVGESATPFEHLSYGDELQRCKRYFIKYGSDGSENYIPVSVFGAMQDNYRLRANYLFSPEMRATPSLSYSTLQVNNMELSNSNTVTNVLLAGQEFSRTGVSMFFHTATVSGQSGGQAGFARVANSDSGYLYIDAEL